MNDNYDLVKSIIQTYREVYGIVRLCDFTPTMQDIIQPYYTSSTVSVKIEPLKFKEGKL